MKDNVDLTLDRTFSRRRRFSPDIRIRLTKIPWYTDNDNIDARISYATSLILVGNKHQRESQRHFKRMDSSDYCDCCGGRMNLHPWDKELGVCHKCESKMDVSKNKCPWREDIRITQLRNTVITLGRHARISTLE